MSSKLATTEKVFTSQVVQLAKTLGWRPYHTFLSKWSVSGFPDVVMVNVKQRRIIYAELKSAVGKVSDKQQEWLDDLKAAGAETYLWKPSQFDEIVAILREKPSGQEEGTDAASNRMPGTGKPFVGGTADD